MTVPWYIVSEEGRFLVDGFVTASTISFGYSLSIRPCLILFWYSGAGVQLGPFGTAATNKPIVPAPGDYDDWWNNDWQGKPKYMEKTCPSAALSTTNHVLSF
jgi:hypothetical protein